MADRVLPEFKSPPVIETVFSVQFTPIEALATSHLGRFWDTIRAGYPSFEIMPPLPAMTEQFRGETGPPGTVVSNTSAQVRCWFVSADGTSLIQVQNDRFIHNWRRVGESGDYPRYRNIRPIFQRGWESMCRFLEAEGLGSPQPNQCEVTYVNHIGLDLEGGQILDIRQVSPILTGVASTGFLPPPVAVVWSAVYDMPNQTGRLHVSSKPGLRRADGKRMVQLELTARGAPTRAGTTHIFDWIEMGHEWVVLAFEDLTTPKMHKLWGKV